MHLVKNQLLQVWLKITSFFLFFPDLTKRAKSKSCFFPQQVSLNATHVFLASGYSLGTYILDWDSRSWQFEDPMEVRRDYLDCGLVQSEENGPEVVALGYVSTMQYTVQLCFHSKSLINTLS